MRWKKVAARCLPLLLVVSIFDPAASLQREVPYRRALQSSNDGRETSVSSVFSQSQPKQYGTLGTRLVDSITFASKYNSQRKKRDAENLKMTAEVTDNPEALFSLKKFDTLDTRLLESFIHPYTRQNEGLHKKRHLDSIVPAPTYSSSTNKNLSQMSRASSRSIHSRRSQIKNQASSSHVKNSDRRIGLELRDTRNMLKLLRGMPNEFKKRFISLLMHSDRSGLSEVVREMIAFHMGSGKVRQLPSSHFIQGSKPISRAKSVSASRTSVNPPDLDSRNDFLPSFQFNARQGNLEEPVSSKESSSKLPVIESAVILHRELISEPGRVTIPINGRVQKDKKNKLRPFTNVHEDFVPSTNPLAKVLTRSQQKNRNSQSSVRSQNQSGKHDGIIVQNSRFQNSHSGDNAHSFGNRKHPQSDARQKVKSHSLGQVQQGFDTNEFSHLLEEIRHSPAFDRIMRNILAMLKSEQKLAEITSSRSGNRGKSIDSESASINTNEDIVSIISSQDLFLEPASSVFISRMNQSNADFHDLLGESTPNFIPEEDILHGEILEDGLSQIETRIRTELIDSTIDLPPGDFSSDKSFKQPSGNLLVNNNNVVSENSAVNQQSEFFSLSQVLSSAANIKPNDNSFASGASTQLPISSPNLVSNDSTFGSNHFGDNLQSDDITFSNSPLRSEILVPNNNAFTTSNSAGNAASGDFISTQFNPSQADPRFPPTFSSPSFAFPNLKPKRIVPLSTDLAGQFFEDDIVNFRQKTSGSSTAKQSLRDEDQFSFDDQINFVPLSTDFDGQLDGFPLQNPITRSENTGTSLTGGGTLPEDSSFFDDPNIEAGTIDDFGLAIGDFAHRPFENSHDPGESNINNFEFNESTVQLQNSPMSTFSPAPGFPIPGNGNNPILSSTAVDTSTNNEIPLSTDNFDGFISGGTESVFDDSNAFLGISHTQSTRDFNTPESKKAPSQVTFGDIMNFHSSSDSDKEFIFPNHSRETSIMSDSLPSQSTSDFRSFAGSPPASSFTEDILTGDFVDDGVSLHDFEFQQPGVGGQRLQPVGIPLPSLNRTMSGAVATPHSFGIPLPGIGSQLNNFSFPNPSPQPVGISLQTGGQITTSIQGHGFQPVGIPLPGLNRSVSEIMGISQSIGVPLPGIIPQQTNFINDFSNVGTQTVGIPLPSGGESSSNTFNNNFAPQFGLSDQRDIVINENLNNDSVKTDDSIEIRDPDSLESDEKIFLQKDFGPASQAFKNNLSSFSYDAVDETGYPEEKRAQNHRFVTFLTPGLIYPYSDTDSVYQGGSEFVQHYNLPQQYILPAQGYNVPQVIPHQYLQPSINSGFRVANGYPSPAALAHYEGRRKYKQIPSSTYTAPPPIPGPYDYGHNPCLSRSVVLTTVLIKDKPASVTTILDRVTSVHMVDRYFVSPVTVLQPYSPNTATYNNYYGGFPLTYLRTDQPSKMHKKPDHQYDRLIRHAMTARDSDKTVGDTDDDDSNNTQTEKNSTAEVIRLKPLQYVRRRRSAEGAHIHKLEPYAQIHTTTIAATPYAPEPRYIMDQTVHVGQPAPRLAQPQPQVAHTPRLSEAYTPQLQVDYSSDLVARAGHYGPVTRVIKSTFFRTLSTKVPTTIIATRSLVSTISYGQTLTTIRSTSVFCIEPAPKIYHGPGITYQGASVYNDRVGTPPLPLYTQNVAASYNAPVLVPQATYPRNPTQFRTWVGSLMDDESAPGYDGVPNKFVLLQHMWPKAFVFGDGSSEGFTKINLTPGNPYAGGVNRRLELAVDDSSKSSGKGKSLVTIHQPLIQSSLSH